MYISTKIRRLFDTGKLKAIVSITIDEMVTIHDIKIIDSGDRLFLSMPSKTVFNVYGKKEFKNVAHPINSKARNLIERIVLKEYQKVIQQNNM